MKPLLSPLPTQHLRDLHLPCGDHPRGQPHLSAASGLVFANDRFFAVADDEHHLGMFDARASTPVQLLRLLPGDLPKKLKKRKARKADFEVLVRLPTAGAREGAALLALGSGSRPNRQLGVRMRVGADGRLDGVNLVDLEALYKPLHKRFAELNIEGGFFRGPDFVLLQRGSASGEERPQADDYVDRPPRGYEQSGKATFAHEATGTPSEAPRREPHSGNAAIVFDAAATLAWLAGAGPAPHARRCQSLALGVVDGVALCFTDGAALDGGRWLFSAVAEAGNDSYNDGACVASAVGLVDAKGAVQWVRLLAGAPKVEGIDARRVGQQLQLVMVTDADDPATPSRLLSATLPVSGS